MDPKNLLVREYLPVSKDRSDRGKSPDQQHDNAPLHRGRDGGTQGRLYGRRQAQPVVLRPQTRNLLLMLCEPFWGFP
jgi:hypothetical protein